MHPTRRRADLVVVGDFLLVEDEPYPTRVLEVERVGDLHLVCLLLWTGDAEGRYLAPRTVVLDPGTACTITGHWSPTDV